MLKTIKIDRTAEGWVSLTATDLDAFATVRLEQPAEGEPFALLVPHEELARTVKTCGKDENSLVASGAQQAGYLQYHLGSQLAEIEFNALPVEEFPEAPHINAAPIPLPEPLRIAIQQALECSSTDCTRLILNGICLDVSNAKAHYVVGTDGRHLFSSNSFSLPLKDSLIIPSHKFVGWKEFNNDGEWQLKTASAEKKDDANYLQISSRRRRFITRQVDGNYPNWRQVIPDSNSVKTTFIFDPQTVGALSTTIERMPCHDEVNATIGLEWKSGKLRLLGKADKEAEWMKVPVEGKGLGKDISIYLNRSLLTKPFGFGLNTVELIDAMSPLRFVHGGRQMIVMPLRPDVGNPPPTTSKPEPEKGEGPKPAAQAPAAQPTEGNTTVPKNNCNGSQHTEPAAEKPTLEKALGDIEKIKGSSREAIPRDARYIPSTLGFPRHST